MCWPIWVNPAIADHIAKHRDAFNFIHDGRAVCIFYLRYFSGDSAELNPLPSAQAASHHAEMMGAAAIISKAKEAYDKG